MPLSDRINLILKYSGKNISEFSRYVGFKTPQTVRELIKGNTKTLSDSVQYKIASAYPEINTEWLTTGKGEMIRTPNSPQSDNIEPLISETTPATNNRLIPFYDAETTGGFNGIVSSATEDINLKGYINAGDWFEGRETAAIRHVGNSMTEYPDGCILAVKEVREFRLLVPGRNYVIETDEYRVTKRVQKGDTKDCIALYSSNQEKYDDGRLVYEPFEVMLSDVRRIFSILGYIVNQSGEAKLIKP